MGETILCTMGDLVNNNEGGTFRVPAGDWDSTKPIPFERVNYARELTVLIDQDNTKIH